MDESGQSFRAASQGLTTGTSSPSKCLVFRVAMVVVIEEVSCRDFNRGVEVDRSGLAAGCDCAATRLRNRNSVLTKTPHVDLDGSFDAP